MTSLLDDDWLLNCQLETSTEKHTSFKCVQQSAQSAIEAVVLKHNFISLPTYLFIEKP